MSGFVVGVDYGIANTVGMLRWPDGTTRPLLFDGSPLLPSGVFVEADGTVVQVGRDALRSARLDPAGYVPGPKSHLGDDEVLVRGQPVPVARLVGAAFVRVGREAIRAAGGAVPRLALAHPAGWDDRRRQLLAEAAAPAGLGVPTLVPAPLAAARHWLDRVGHAVQPGRYLLVYDLGAGGCEVSLVRAGPSAGGLEMVATERVDDVGGQDLDRAFVRTVGAQLIGDAPDAWWRLRAPSSTAERRHGFDFLDAVRAAREALSRETAVALHVPLVERDVSVSREQFERAAEPTVQRAAQAAAALLGSAGVASEQLAEVLLVGGSTRTPLVAQVVQRELGVRPTLSDEPELAVAEGLPGEAAPVSEPVTVAVPVVGAAPAPRARRLVPVAAGVTAVVLALVLCLAALLLGRGPDTAGGGAAAPENPPASSPYGSGALGSRTPPATSAAPAAAQPSPTVNDTPSSAPPTSSAPPGPVVVAVTVSPTTGGCSTDFVFTAHFTVLAPAKYHWRWVFGGPDGYLVYTGYHDQDKTGDVGVTRKFSTPGAYWGRVEIVTPVAVMSNAAQVLVSCATG
jgi:Hsp70 protein